MSIYICVDLEELLLMEFPLGGNRINAKAGEL